MNPSGNDFRQPQDVALLTYSVLKRLNCGGVDTFEQRLKSQKVQYFAQLFGVSPHYQFGLYVRGPYSSDLAHDLFTIKNKGVKAENGKFVPEELENRFTKLRTFIGGMARTNRQLEVVATFHWLRKIAGLSEEQAKERLKELKEVTGDEIRHALKALSTLP